MLGNEAIVRFFEQNNICDIFHLPGIHTLPLNKEFCRRGNSVFLARHESNLAFMADGYARATGRCGVMVITPGPALGNVMAACMEAYGSDVPLLIIHVALEGKGSGKGALHEITDPEGMFRHITRGTIVVDKPAALIPGLEAALRHAVSGRPGPALISVPYTFFEKEVSYPEIAPSPERRGAGFSGLGELLRGKERLVIIGGWALMEPRLRDLLVKLCREHAIPFLTSTAGKGVLREDGPEAFGNMMRKGIVREILAQADLVIALGTRLREVDSKRRGVKIRELVHLDIDDRWINKNYPARLWAAAPMGEAVEALGDALQGFRSTWDLPAMKALQHDETERLKKDSPGFAVMSCIRSCIPDDACTVWDLNMIAYWAEYCFPVLEQRTFIAPRGISPIFYAVPAAIGAKIGRPERPCLCVVGDGGGLPGLAELATVQKYRIPVVFLVYNNSGFGILENYMRGRYAMENTMDLTNPDFVRLAEAFGVRAARAENLDELERVLRTEITWEEPFLVEFKYPVFPPPWYI